MKRIIAMAWIVAAAGLASCGGDDSSLVPAPSNEVAPDGLSYPDPNMFIQGTQIAPLVPTVATGSPTNYMVIPELPAGLRLGADGRITGIPMEPKSPATYLVTAGNSAGTASFGIRITVIGRFTVGGVVSGLTGTGLVLTNNGADDLSVTADGEFTFNGLLGAGSPYSVAVATQPGGQTCGIAQGSGTLANYDIGNVIVTCHANDQKVATFGTNWASGLQPVGKVLYLDCSGFPPPATVPVTLQGHILDPATNLVTQLRQVSPDFTPLNSAALPAPEFALTAHCGAGTVTVDRESGWVYLTDPAHLSMLFHAPDSVSAYGPIDYLIMQ